MRPAPDWLTARPIAHRALHDAAAGRMENSRAAFAAAIEAGYAIECDLQVSADGDAVVFHDPGLGRLTGVDGLVSKTPTAALRDMRLGGTEDGIYTLREHLDQTAGAVPLVLELKGDGARAGELVEAVAQALEGYGGRVAVMSFAYDLMRQCAKHLPQLPLGLTAERDGRDHAAIMEECNLSFMSYAVDDLPDPFVETMRVQGKPVITWTVRTPEQIALTVEHADQMTFEGFLPKVEHG